MWLDRTALNFTESDLTEAFSWMELYFNWWHRTALGCTSLVSAGMHCARHCAPDWYTLHCTSVGGTGLDSTALHCIVAVGLYWLGLFRMEIHCNVLAWMRLDLSRWDWTGVSGTGLHWTRQRYTSLHWIAVDCAWLHQTALHCTVLGWMEITIQDSLHSTGLNLEELFWVA